MASESRVNKTVRLEEKDKGRIEGTESRILSMTSLVHRRFRDDLVFFVLVAQVLKDVATNLRGKSAFDLETLKEL